MPFGKTRTAAFYAKEILRYVTGSEVKVNAVIDFTTVALNSDNRRIVESGQVLRWIGAPGASKVRPVTVANEVALTAADVAGVLETPYEGWPEATEALKDDKAVALFAINANFDTTQLLSYTNNATVIKAAMTGSGNGRCANCTFNP